MGPLSQHTDARYSHPHQSDVSYRWPTSQWRKTLEKLVHPAFIQAFILTGLAEWGDRSQIATIALAAEEDPFSVTLGAIMGHMICTAFAGEACEVARPIDAK
eukprot:scaffold2539_cov388-Prasinococcus_capsulatus_cf.AAC.9